MDNTTGVIQLKDIASSPWADHGPGANIAIIGSTSETTTSAPAPSDTYPTYRADTRADHAGAKNRGKQPGEGDIGHDDWEKCFSETET